MLTKGAWSVTYVGFGTEWKIFLDRYCNHCEQVTDMVLVLLGYEFRVPISVKDKSNV